MLIFTTVLWLFISQPLYATNSFEQQKWIADAWESSQSQTKETSPFFAHISFSDGQVAAYAGCNHIFATYERHSKKLLIEHLGRTMMQCDDKNAQNEQRFIDVLSRITSYEFTSENELVLISEQGKLFLRQEPSKGVVASLEDTDWQFVGVSDGVVSSAMVDSPAYIRFSQQAISGMAGCNQFYGQYQREGEQLIGIQIAETTRKLCESAVMQEEEQLLELLEQVESFTIDGQSQLLLETKTAKSLSFIVCEERNCNK